MNENYINKKACKSLIHVWNNWNDQTDVYLQVGVKSCHASLKCYVGTFIGPPSEIEINRSN